MRGWGPFRTYLVPDNAEHLRRFGFEVSREPHLRSSWMTFSESIEVCWLLRERYDTLPRFYWGFVKALWGMGLIEPHKAMSFSWRNDFRPFPWRGRKRFRNA